MNYHHANKFPHACIAYCQRCEEAEVGERLAIQMGSAPVDKDAWKEAIRLLLESRRPGQRQLGV
jgi:hypothetical protein